MSNHSYTALYYPFIHFKDDGWLKLAALYWDRMARIVPPHYTTEDSETVSRLGDFVDNRNPEYVDSRNPGFVDPEFGKTFTTFIQENVAGLKDRYAVHLKDQWQPVPREQQPPLAGGPSGTDPRLSYVFYEKMPPDLVAQLRGSGIAVPDQYDERWIGMHPELARVYMTALADQLATDHGLYPITSDALDHIAAGGLTIQRLAQALLRDVDLIRSKPDLNQDIQRPRVLRHIWPWRP